MPPIETCDGCPMADIDFGYLPEASDVLTSLSQGYSELDVNLSGLKLALEDLRQSEIRMWYEADYPDAAKILEELPETVPRNYACDVKITLGYCPLYSKKWAERGLI